MKPRVLIQVMLSEDGNVHYSSTSQNHVTNLGLLGVAQGLCQKQIEKMEPTNIVKPESLVL